MSSTEMPGGTAVVGGSIVDQILGQFLDKLGSEPGYEEATARLRKVLLDQHEDSEAVLMTAVFGEDAE